VRLKVCIGRQILRNEYTGKTNEELELRGIEFMVY
jgi:hypothetical protein